MCTFFVYGEKKLFLAAFSLLSIPYMACLAEPEVINPQHLRVLRFLVRVVASIADHLAVFSQRQVRWYLDPGHLPNRVFGDRVVAYVAGMAFHAYGDRVEEQSRGLRCVAYAAQFGL